MASLQPEASGDHALHVANHYNKLEEGGKFQRTFSRIFFLRNFNNWIKTVLINEALGLVRENDPDKQVDVLDLCSGKGGDLLKWKKGRIRHLVCADIAETSVQQSESRYNQSRHRERNIFDAEFHVADCTKTRLKTKYKNPNQKFDLTSCQFSFHYCFESYPQAVMMLRNACESLKPGGYFIGTTPNANEIVHRLKDSQGNSFGNEVYNISFHNDEKKQFPLFGTTYNFHLEGVVDCPEFLVYFPALEKLAEEFGMKLVTKKPFAKYFKENVSKSDYPSLLNAMQALESYPARGEKELVSNKPEDYVHAVEYYSQLTESLKDADQSHHSSKITFGTMSKAEWEAATVYLVFVFQKVKDVCPPLMSSPSETDLHTSSPGSSSIPS